MSYKYWIGFKTLLVKEIRRFLAFWPDTVIPPIVTTALYFLVFGHLMGQRIGKMDGVHYVEFIAPGLIMMSVITSSYANVAFSFFTSKFFRSIEEILIAPIPNWLVLLGFILGGVARGIMVAIIVTITALFFTHLTLKHPLLMIMVIILTSAFFSLAGFINGLMARKFDDIGIVPTFILTPLAYLGGVFFSIQLLPEVWQIISKFNPILYVINLFRFSTLGITDINVFWAFFLLCVMVSILFVLGLWLLKTGYKLKS